MRAVEIICKRFFFFGDKLKNKNSWIVICLQVRLKPPHSKGDTGAVNVNLFLCVCVCVKPVNDIIFLKQLYY